MSTVKTCNACRETLDVNYTKKLCEPCLEINRVKDRAKRAAAAVKNAEIAAELAASGEIPTTKICKTCVKTRALCCFVGSDGKEKITCQDCRDDCRKQDANRDKDHRRELERKNYQKPEKKAVKKVWVENNYEKVTLAGLNYRARQITENQEAFLKRNAETAQRHRDTHPEEQAQINLNRINSRKAQYKIYIRDSTLKNVEFALSFDEYTVIVANPCDYCGCTEPRGFNGIDKVNSTVGYTIENSVSCCQMCNYMKASLHKDVFLGRVEHIASFNHLYNGVRNDAMFSNYTTRGYGGYAIRASKKNICFDITEHEFHQIRDDNCYICGKRPSASHNNGIDRFDNTIGYTMLNCRACCGDCNFMKKNYEYDTFIGKIISICNHSINALRNLKENNQPSTDSNNTADADLNTEDDVSETVGSPIDSSNIAPEVTLTNKTITKRSAVRQTPEEVKENARIRMAKNRQTQAAKYGDAEYLKAKALKMKELRQSRKDQLAAAQSAAEPDANLNTDANNSNPDA